MQKSKFSKKTGAKEKRYEQIVQAAEKVLIKRGYENATFNDFAEEAVYNKRTLYLYFPDKDDLFAAVIIRLLNRLTDHVNKHVKKDSNGFENIIQIAEAYFSFFYINKTYYNLLWTFENKYFLFSEKPTSSPNIKKSYYIRTKNIEFITKLFHKGIDDNSIKTTHEPTLIITLVWGQTLGLLQLISKGETALINRHNIDPKKLFSAHIEHIKKQLNQ